MSSSWMAVEYASIASSTLPFLIFAFPSSFAELAAATFWSNNTEIETETQKQ